MPSKSPAGLAPKTREYLPALSAAFDHVAGVGGLTLNSIRALLFIAANENCGFIDVERKVFDREGSNTKSSLSNYAVNALIEGTDRNNYTGLRFVRSEVGFRNRKEKTLSLTPLGQKFLNDLAGILEYGHGSTTSRGSVAG